MQNDQPASSFPTDSSFRQPPLPSPVPLVIPNANANPVMTPNDPQNEKEQPSSISYNSSPRVTSILMSPSDGAASRPRSSEGRLTSLNLPRSHNRAHRHSSGGYKRRIASNLSSRADATADTEEDGFLNFGLGNDQSVPTEDPRVLEDVQRVLRSKALRESDRNSPSNLDIERSPHPSPEGSSTSVPANKVSEQVVQTIESIKAARTPPRPGISVATQTSGSRGGSITFPSMSRSPTRSMGSLSSLEPAIKSPLPVLMSLPDGTAYLDWSGNNAPLELKDRSILGRTLSLTRRKPKKSRPRNFARASLDQRGSQADLHSALLDSIRRTCKRETLSRAEIVKEELSRRYTYLNVMFSANDSLPPITHLAKSSSNEGSYAQPWLAWSRKTMPQPLNNKLWIIPGNILEEKLRAIDHSPYGQTMRPVSPPYSFPSPISSPRSSFSMIPGSDGGTRANRRIMDPSRSLSVEAFVPTSVPTSPAHALSFTNAATSLEQHGLNEPPKNGEPRTSAKSSSSPRSSVEVALDGPSPVKGEKESSIRKRFRVSLGGDMKSINESGVSPIFLHAGNSNPALVGNGSSSRLHLAVGSMFGKILKSGDEGNERGKARSRSSISDNDSVREPNGVISDGRGSIKSGSQVNSPQITTTRRREIPQLRAALHATDGDNGAGLTTAKTESFVKRGYPDPYGSVDKHRLQATHSVLELGSSLQPWLPKRRTRYFRSIAAANAWDKENLQDVLRKFEEEEERLRAIYKTRELLLVAANDHNRKIARLLKAIAHSVRQFEAVQQEFSKTAGREHIPVPMEILDAVSADPATTLRHGKGWKAVEESYKRFHRQQNLLTSYLATLDGDTFDIRPDLRRSIDQAIVLWNDLKLSRDRIQAQVANVEPVLKRAMEHAESVQKEYNDTQKLVETDYPELSRIYELETAIRDSSGPQNWLEFAAVWLPEHVLELIGGFIRFFGVPISEKFIRPLLWYFFRNRYYWKVYSTVPPPSERAWYTRLAYWVIILSVLAWFCTADSNSLTD